MKYIITPFIKRFDFKGKATIKEFWLFFIAQTILFICLGFIGGLTGYQLLGKIFLLISLIPFLALGFRRLNYA
jgi:uncharacterized membrane protein YhaH (DUF805 family)